MGISFVKIRDRLNALKIDYPDFNIFKQRGTVVKIAQWQPKGNITFEESTGFHSPDESHMQKAEAFLKTVQVKAADIVITPEYSFPWNSLEKILFKGDITVGYGKLWCLGMEGISFSKFESFMNKCQTNENLVCIAEELEYISSKNFVGCLIYVFKARKKHVCVIQLKTTAASDRWGELEANGLTTGNEIYCFDDDKSKYCLLSVICADALNQDNSYLNRQLEYSKYLLLHPQLNPKPLHRSFNQMRANLMNFSFKNIRILAQNWSRGTLVTSENLKEKIEIKDSFSACYYAGANREAGFSDIYQRNKKQGISLMTDDHVLIWFMPDNEHCMIYNIDAFDVEGINAVIGNHKEPVGDKYMEYDGGSSEWQPKDACNVCSIDWEWLEKQFGLERCSCDMCSVNKLHLFFALLFAKNMYDDIRLEKGKNSVVFLKNGSGEIQVLRERCKFINSALEREIIPPKFSNLKNHNYHWTLEGNGNLAENESGNKNSNPISVVYVDSGTDFAINKGIKAFEKMMGRERMDRMILYYLSESGLQYYDKLYNTSVNNPELVHSVGEII